MVVLIEPVSEDKLTGGYIYNDEICRAGAAIDQRLSLVHGEAIDFLERLADHSDPEIDLVVVDSLFLDSDDLLECLGTVRGALRIGLIHYLPFEESGISVDLQDNRIKRVRRACSVLDGLIVTSYYAARALKRTVSACPPISVVPPGVADAINLKKRRRSWPPRTILTVGAVTPQKGHRLALEALRPLRSYEWRWTIVGGSSDSFAASLRARIEGLSLDDRVDFVGRVPQNDIGDWYRCSDLFLFPTLHESYGMVCAESVANGLPVIAYRTGGISRIIEHNVNGWLASTGSVSRLRSHIDRAFRSPAGYERISRGSAIAAGGFRSWQRAAEDFDMAITTFEKSR